METGYETIAMIRQEISGLVERLLSVTGQLWHGVSQSDTRTSSGLCAFNTLQALGTLFALKVNFLLR